MRKWWPIAASRTISHVLFAFFCVQRGQDVVEGGSGRLDKKELDLLLKFGAYHVLKDDKSLDQAQTIEQILEQSEDITRDEKSSTIVDTQFAQATFALATDDGGVLTAQHGVNDERDEIVNGLKLLDVFLEELSMDDPDFWRKIGLAPPALDTSLGIRQRRQVHRFGARVDNEPLSGDDFVDSSTDYFDDGEAPSDDRCANVRGDARRSRSTLFGDD